MVSHLFYYQLALLALVWLFVMLHVAWSEPGLTTPAVPATPKRQRATEPKPFAGLTHKPPCPVCEQEMGESAPAPAPPVRPAPMPPTHRRPRTRLLKSGFIRTFGDALFRSPQTLGSIPL